MAGKNKTYELMLKIGGKVDGSLKPPAAPQTRTWLRWGKRQRPRERSLPVPW